MTSAEHNAARSHSYEVQETLPLGSQAVLTADVYYGRTIPSGTFVRVLSYSNAGFRGIEAWVQLTDGSHATVCAGLLKKEK